MDAAASLHALMPPTRPRPGDDRAELASRDAEATHKDHGVAGREDVKATEVNIALVNPDFGDPHVHADQVACQYRQTQQKPAATPELSAATKTLQSPMLAA